MTPRSSTEVHTDISEERARISLLGLPFDLPDEVRSSETSVNLTWTPLHNIPEDSALSHSSLWLLFMQGL
jgi:hypothetical protein